MVGHIFVVNYKFIIMKDLNSQEYFFADSQEEAKKEKEKRAALHNIFPILMGGKEDKTNYVIRNENKATPSTEIPSIATSNPFATNPMGSNAKKAATTFENPKNDFNFDPWQREKTLDRMRVVKYPKLLGEMGTAVYPRANYRSKEEFDYINNSKFNSIIDKNLEHEGGYVNNKNDRGGKTKYGITKPFMEDFKQALPEGKAIPIKELTVDDAKKLLDEGDVSAWNAYAETTHTGTSEAYKKKDEELVITGIEQRTALLLGEIEPGQVTRTNHNGKPVSVESPISNKKIEE